MMFPSGVSPKKRKHQNEFYDPDYVRMQSSPNKKSRNENITNTNTGFDTVFGIISNEFENEITRKQEQLAEIENRLERARALLDRLRYVIVSEYFRKQELSIAAVDVTAIRGKTTLFENDINGPQKTRHPSLNNIVGKRPSNISEIISRPLPERVAAQNALTTIRARSHSQRNQERRLQQLIREKGLVIDHSKNEEQLPEAITNYFHTKSKFQNSSNAADKLDCANSTTSTHKTLHKLSPKKLNTTRLNNKKRHLIVIGNTSMYIGAESDAGGPNTSGYTHKWLVYVQSKDSCIPLETFIKKVRFHLHHSFRPHDIVDVRTPPFQLARRGWGEFPIRIQIFFHENLHQKPVQLIHNLVLDRTLSGMHTLGAETLVEVWLRTNADIKQTEQGTLPNPKEKDEENEQPICKEEKSEKNCTSQQRKTLAHVNTTTKRSEISFIKSKECSDVDMLGIQYQNDVAQADLRKIRSTVVVSEPIANPSTNSPIKILGESSQKLQNTSVHNIEAKKISPPTNQCARTDNFAPSTLDCKPIDQKVPPESVVQAPTSKSNINNITETQSCAQDNSNGTKAVLSNKSMQLTTPMIMTLPTSNLANSQNVTNVNKNKNNIIALSRVGKLMPLKIGNVSMTNSPNANYSPISVPLKNMPGNAVLQKKLVQLIDAEGKIKYMQVLMATTQKPTSLAANTKELVGNAKKEAVVSVPNAISMSPSTAAMTKASTSIRNNDYFQKVTDTTPVQLSSTSSKNTQIQSTSRISSDKTVDSPRQMVFQKEGKLFIIDPLQMKLKQQRRKQVSLLKPKTNLQSQCQKQLPDQKTQSKPFPSIISDHDYTYTLNVKDSATTTTQTMQSAPIKSLHHQVHAQVTGSHLDIRQKRPKTKCVFEFLQQRRIQLEKDFLDQNIQNMRSAVDYILRRLPMIAPKGTLAAAFSFVNHSFEEFDALPVMKQRACEWLRAKYVTRFVRNHKQLQKLNCSSKERFWSTREVLVYARYHAFTPRLKSLDAMSSLLLPKSLNLSTETKPSPGPSTGLLIKPKQDNNNNQGQEFSQFIKNEVKCEQENFQYESITHNYRIASWLEGPSQKLIINETNTETDEVIDIVSISVPENCARVRNVNLKQEEICNEKKQLYLPVPEHLEESSNLVSDICRDLNIQLQPEQIEQDVIFPMAQSVIAHCLKLFVEKLIRRAVASKQNLTNRNTLNITAHDIGKVLVRHAEFDFLTNKLFGTYKYDSE